MQIEQHYLYRSREQKKARQGKNARPYDVSLLSYTWKNVSSWKYDPSKRICVLYDKNGNVLDHLDLNLIVKNYIKCLSEEDGYETSMDHKIEDKEKYLKV